MLFSFIFLAYSFKQFNLIIRWLHIYKSINHRKKTQTSAMAASELVFFQTPTFSRHYFQHAPRITSTINKNSARFLTISKLHPFEKIKKKCSKFVQKLAF